MTNFLSAQPQETTISVTKSADPTPELTVEGPLHGKAFAADSFYITAIAKVGFMLLICRHTVCPKKGIDFEVNACSNLNA